MRRRPALITQAELARAIRAAKQAGAAEIEVKLGDAVMVVRLSSTDKSTAKQSLEPPPEEGL